MKKLFFIIGGFLICISAFAQKNNEHYLITGTYTYGKSKGIYVHKFNTETGESTEVSNVSSSNPSFLAVSPDGKYIYAANEDTPGKVASFSFNKSNGQLTFLNQQPSHGLHPCYITIDKTGKWVITGNYSSGTIAVHRVVKEDGSLSGSNDSIQHTGSSVVEGRQEGPHVHATVLSKDNKYLYVPDLGMDKIMIYRFNAKTGALIPAEQPFVITKPGAGPRHFEIHPNGKFAYLMEELTGTVSVYAVLKNGGLHLLQNSSGLPHDFLGAVGSADIHVSPDGRFLYCSNRGESNSIGIFSIDIKSGMLGWVGHQSTLGKTPRNFNFDPTGNFLLVANQGSDEIVIFKRDKQTGLLTDTGKRIQVPNPVCLKWIPAG
jgi:6-phosphogluconolactonase